MPRDFALSFRPVSHAHNGVRKFDWSNNSMYLPDTGKLAHKMRKLTHLKYKYIFI